MQNIEVVIFVSLFVCFD